MKTRFLVSLVSVVFLLAGCGQKVDESGIAGTYRGALTDLTFKSNGKVLSAPHSKAIPATELSYAAKGNTVIIDPESSSPGTYTVMKDGSLSDGFGGTYKKM